MKFDLTNFLELDTKALMAINGGGTCGGGSCSSGGSSYRGGGSCSSSSSYGGSCGSGVTKGGGNCSSVNLSNGNGGGGNNGGNDNNVENPTYTNQSAFSDKYGDRFGDNACAATSLLNEISEEYTKQTGKALTEEQINQAMAAAINAGGVAIDNAHVDDWAIAANAMADSMGLAGEYSYTSDSTQASASIYAWDKNGDGYVDHFVNDIGNGQYYDPGTGQTGNVNDLSLATKGLLGGSRDLVYNR